MLFLNVLLNVFVGFVNIKVTFHCIVSFCKHYENVTFECFLNVPKKVATLKKLDELTNKTFQKKSLY